MQDVRNGGSAQPNDTRTIYCMTKPTLAQSIFSSTPACTSRFPHNDWALAQCMTGVDIDKCPSMNLAPVAIPECTEKNRLSAYTSVCVVMVLECEMTERGCIIRRNVAVPCYGFSIQQKWPRRFRCSALPTVKAFTRIRHVQHGHKYPSIKEYTEQ